MEKKILIIPDVHGRQFWRAAVDTGDYDRVIFLGDYVDPYPHERISQQTALCGLADIIGYYDRHPDKVVLLLGNHDMHYLSPHYRDVCPSCRYNAALSNYFRLLFTQAYRFKLAHEETVGGHRYLFTHAGINQSWLKRNAELIVVPDAEHLNGLLRTEEGIESLTEVGAMRWGDYPTGSMVWCDCDELAESDPLPDVYQVVGHSQQIDGTPVISDHFACLDCRSAFVLDESGFHQL